MKLNISTGDLQGKVSRKEQIIICDEAGKLYELIEYVKPKDDETTSR